MTHDLLPERLAVILVEPQQPGNIGAVCRAMANFDVTDLRLVNPCRYLHPEAHKFAVFASELLGQAQVFPSLAAAVTDLEITLAATRRPGRLRGELRHSGQISSLVAGLSAQGRVGLVFGREDCGLTSAEVGACSHAVSISGVAASGSLNLAQAVLVFLYEISRAEPAGRGGADEQGAPASQGEMNGLVQEMEAVLHRIAFLNPQRPEPTLNVLRDLLRRARPSSAEVGVLRGMWSQIAWSVRDWRGSRKGGV